MSQTINKRAKKVDINKQPEFIKQIKSEIDNDNNISKSTKINLNTNVNKLVYDTLAKKDVDLKSEDVWKRILYLINEEPNKDGKINPITKFTIAQRFASIVKKSITLKDLLTLDEIDKLNRLVNEWKDQSDDKMTDRAPSLKLVKNKIPWRKLQEFVDRLKNPMDKLLIALYVYAPVPVRSDYDCILLVDNDFTDDKRDITQNWR